MNHWPNLNYHEWKDTYETLHRWVQIIGKIRLSKEPWSNHSWSSTLYVTPNGLTTSAIPINDGCLAIEFDFIEDRLHFYSSNKKRVHLQLQSETVASFYKRVQNVLIHLGIKTNFDPRPNEINDTTPFYEDKVHHIYNSKHANDCHQVLVRANNVLKQFRTRFIGKCSPVHFFWGSFDLAVTRFSGRIAPEHPGGVLHLSDKIVREAYSHELSSCGFWPGNDLYPHAAFYSYAYPEPSGFSEAKINPPTAFYHSGLKEFILPYHDVQNSENPAETLMSFLQSTYEAAANLGKWDRKILEDAPYLASCQQNLNERNAS